MSVPTHTEGAEIPSALANAPASVTVSGEEYRQLLADQKQLQELKDAHSFLEERFRVLREAYQSVHHSYYLLVKDELKLDEWEKEPVDLENSVPFESIIAELERKYEGK